MTRAPARAALQATLQDALALIRASDLPADAGAVPGLPVPAPAVPATVPAAVPAPLPAQMPPLPSLLAQCRAIADAAALPDDTGPGPLRSFHHFACTGGTLVSKCLAVLPNTRLLSEIAPLSPIGVDPKAKPRFLPSDVILQLKNDLRPPPQDDLVEIFLAGIATLHRQAGGRGERLVLRDHAHSQYCTGATIGDHAPLHRMLAGLGPVRSALLVRHPLDSYLSLLKNGWVHFAPQGLGEYARRYLAFLDAHDDMPMFRYEDFVAAPAAELARICAALDLPFHADALDLFGLARVSGDSGRKSDVIAPRPRRPLPAPVLAEIAEAAEYGALCARLAYPAQP